MNSLIAISTVLFLCERVRTVQSCSLNLESARDDILAAFKSSPERFVVHEGSMWMFDFDQIPPDCSDCGNANPASTYGCPRFAETAPRFSRSRVAEPRRVRAMRDDEIHQSLDRLDSPNIDFAKITSSAAATARGVLPLSCEWPLREDEAIVLYGCTPDTMAYFAITPYLYTISPRTPTESLVFASLGDSFSLAQNDRGDSAFSRLSTELAILQDGLIHRSTKAPWNASFALVLSRNRQVLDVTANALRARGMAVNTFGIPPPPAGATMDSTYTVLLRGAVPLSKESWSEWMRDPRLSAVRLIVKDVVARDVFQPPTLITRQTVDETGFAATHDALVSAVRAHVASAPGRSAVVSRSPRPQLVADNSNACVLSRINCGGDNRDTNYIRSSSITLANDEDIAFAVGFLHTASGNAHYTSLALYSQSRRLAVVSVEDAELRGTANDWLGGDQSALENFYVVAFARDCSAHVLPYRTPCVDVPSVGFPSVALSEAVQLWERPYSTVATTIGPWWRSLILPAVVVSVPAAAAPPPPSWTWSCF